MHKSGKAIGLLIALGLPAVAAAQQGFKYWNPLDTTHVVPPTLSAMGFFTDIVSKDKKVIPGAHYYDVNTPLWSDDAKKKRWVLLKPGSAPIKYTELDDYWEYPDSTVFVKEFLIDTIAGDPTSRVAWETRVLLLKKELVDSVAKEYNDVWFGYTYKWNADQKDAVLISSRGQNDSIRVYPQGKGMPSVMKKWAFPSFQDCKTCHGSNSATRSDGTLTHSRSVLGFFTAQLNRPHRDSANLNQIEYFFRRNVFSGTKPNYATAPKWYAVDGVAGTDDQKARSYIAANCSGCHGTRGMPTNMAGHVSLNYDYHSPLDSMLEFRHRTVSWPYGLDDVEPKFYPQLNDGNNPYRQDSLMITTALVVPGYPEKSVILFRQLQRRMGPPTGAGEDYVAAEFQMPPLAVFEKDTAALTLLARWIKNMEKTPDPNAVDPNSSIFTRAGRINLKGPAIQGRSLVLPAELSESGRARVSMTALTGRTVELSRTSNTTFAIPANMPRGVYIIKVGSKSFTRNLF